MKSQDKIKIYEKHRKNILKKNPCPQDLVVKNICLNELVERKASIATLLNNLTLDEAITALTKVYEDAALTFKIAGIRTATANNIRLVKESSGYNNYFSTTREETESEWKKRVYNLSTQAAEDEIRDIERSENNRRATIRSYEKKLKQLKSK